MQLESDDIATLENAVIAARLIAERLEHHPLLLVGADAVRDAIHAFLDDLYAIDPGSDPGDNEE